MRPELKRKLINSVLLVVLVSGVMRFASGELSRQEEVYQRKLDWVQSQLVTSRTEVQTLKTQLKEMKEKKRIVRTKDADGNEKEVIETETDTKEKSTEQQTLITELRSEIKSLKREAEYLKSTSTPLGQVGVGYDPISRQYYFRAGYALFGPVGVEFLQTTNFNQADYFAGVTWTF